MELSKPLPGKPETRKNGYLHGMGEKWGLKRKGEWESGSKDVVGATFPQV